MTTDFFDDDARYEPPARSRPVDEPLEIAAPAAATPPSVDLPALARLARELGPRELPVVLERAREIGRALGTQLDPNPRNAGTKAYYSWQVKNRDGTLTTVEGPTIDLMDALAGEWGRLVYQVEVLRERPPQVWLRARVVDLQTLLIHERPFVVHLRPPPAAFASKPDEQDRWRVMQLQSAESKAIRGVLERVIPQHVQHAALEAARDAASTTQLGLVPELGRDGKPILRDGKAVMRRRSLAEAIKQAVDGLSSLTPPLPLALVERWLGKPRDQWLAGDLGALRGLYRRWRDGAITASTLEAEIGDLEAGRTPGDEGTPTENGASSDRLADLGLGLGAPPAGAQASAAPAAGAPSTSSSAPTTARAAAPDRRGELLERVRAYEESHPEIAHRAIDAEGGLARAGIARLDKIVARIVRAIADAQHAAIQGPDDELPPEAEPAPWTGPVGAELGAECRALAADLGPEVTRAALASAGIPAIDGAPEPALRRLLEALLEAIPEGGE